jgi:hypothetical protein
MQSRAHVHYLGLESTDLQHTTQGRLWPDRLHAKLLFLCALEVLEHLAKEIVSARRDASEDGFELSLQPTPRLEVHLESHRPADDEHVHQDLGSMRMRTP